MGFVPKTVTLRYLRCAGQFGHGCRVRVFCAGEEQKSYFLGLSLAF